MRLSATTLFCALVITLRSLAQSTVDPNLTVQTWVKGLNDPTSMAFLPDGRALILEQTTGRVQIMSGRKIAGTALDLPVANDAERGLLGITLSPTFDADHFVYLFYTAAAKDGGAAISNSVKRFSFDGSELIFRKKVIDLQATSESHNSGRLNFGPDGKLYISIGDQHATGPQSNNDSVRAVSAIGSILRVNPSGSAVQTNPFYSVKNTGSKRAKNLIYAYGVRNTFGMDFDPISGALWETENGPTSFDEVNRITPGFNGGWNQTMGPVSRTKFDLSKLVSLGARSHYEDPKFSWTTPIAPTDAMFFPDERLGAEFKNDLFVVTYRGGNVLDFNLTRSRKSLSLTGSLDDGVADNSLTSRFAEQSGLIFAQGFGQITDLAPGPGGMFVLSHDRGVLYRITTSTPTPAFGGVPVPEPASGAIWLVLLLRRACRNRNLKHAIPRRR